MPALLLAAVVLLPLLAAPEVAAQPAPPPHGQVELSSDGGGGRRPVTAVFDAPAGRATLVTDSTPGTIAVVRVNGRAVPEAMRGLRRGGVVRTHLAGVAVEGSNTLSVRFVRGDARVVVAHPTLTDSVADPATVGMDADALAAIDDAVLAALGPDADSRFPGAVVLVARHGVVVKETAYGAAQTYAGDTPLSQPRPMTTDTVFDLASITKVAATTAAVMHLVDAGRIDLDAPVAEWLPELSGDGKDAITVRHLLTHTSGLWEWQPTYLHADTWAEAIAYVTGLPLRYEVGAGRHYSDLGFMLLAELVQRETGRDFADYVAEVVHEPLGMDDTAFSPGQGTPGIAATSLGNTYEPRMVATGSPYPILEPAPFDDWRDYTLVGEVNDGNAHYAFGGVAGHAGLFATARDLATFGQTLLNGGGYDTARLASEGVVAEFTRDQYQRGQGLGFWTDRLASVDGPDAGGIGHNGFTGTDFLVDPERGLVVVLLTNRQHPAEPYASTAPVWREVIAAAVAAVES